MNREFGKIQNYAKIIVHMEIANKKFVKILFAITAISFLWFGTFDSMHHMSEMKPDMAGGSGCLFNGQTEVCTMNFFEHMALWQGMFTSLPQNTALLDLLILALVLVAVIAFWHNPLMEFSERVASRWRLYIKQNPQIRLFNSLIEEFFQGILNPKIFASTI
ncbi:MAG: hypothetical protein A3J46_01965 [Candidatus Yanofskybacteria bacterium RIFCSPHIGHO2_02_FULL_41_11]|uniref:Uncharacterized protein n=1 Tax=Candidatus Yanofskybacteria bacterium RIFCSPHIGHO2_02_FULL_41_11 TaxID=1802675 RepID=A0A1F8FDY9_9BACT|nr:MAG: hypothetical protein A3J46_01965 [Candidatus Yanofskybacteria bacterium RIFCSPHIGHO2_02_FULL_41_11]